MSSGCECQFIEVTDKGHYYLLEQGSAPKNAWDWREFATAYGPFPTQAEAVQHLADHHSNPGGWGELGPVAYHELDEITKELVDDAPKHTERLRQCTVPLRLR